MSSTPLPDLSHLTDEERRIIESVLQRQRSEEYKEDELVRRKQEELEQLEQHVRMRGELRSCKLAAVDTDATCCVCLKTKFADGIGHTCQYCTVRCCAKCGGKVTLRSGKVIWVCILCRKKQELLIKSGRWIHGGMGSYSDEIRRQMEADLRYEGATPAAGDSADWPRRPSLQRVTSLQGGRSNAAGFFGLGSASFGSGATEAGRHLRRQFSQERPAGSRPSTANYQFMETSGGIACTVGTPHNPQQSQHHPHQSAGFYGRESAESSRSCTVYPSGSGNSGDGGGYSTGTGSGDARLQQQYNHQYQQQQQQLQQQPRPQPGSHHLSSSTAAGSLAASSAQLRSRQLSVSSSDDEVRSTPDCTSCGEEEIESTESVSERGGWSDRHSWRSNSSSLELRHSLDSCSDSQFINRPRHRRTKTTVPTAAAGALSAAAGTGGGGGGSCSGVSGGSQWVRGNSLDWQRADSGIEMSVVTMAVVAPAWSSARPEEPSLARCQHPVTWQPSGDGTGLLGHMILKKSSTDPISGQPISSASILGLKVVGGKRLDGGRLGAMIERVKKDSLADTVGHLRPGDEVIEWNGRTLQGKTFEEVYDIIVESRQEPQVELMVFRRLPESSHRRNTYVGFESQAYEIESRSTKNSDRVRRDRRPSVTVTSPGSSEGRTVRSNIDNIGGRVQMRIWYDARTLRLVVTLLCAVDLVPREFTHCRSPYAKIFLLPDRSEKSKRRTKTLSNTLEPRWNQALVYTPLRRSDLRLRRLELTIWDYDRSGTNDFLGEVTVDLASHPLDDTAEWYQLTVPEDFNLHMQRYGVSADADRSSTIASTEHLSPPSVGSRLSESDLSETEAEELRRLGADSSSCSPPTSERSDRRSHAAGWGSGAAVRPRSGLQMTGGSAGAREQASLLVQRGYSADRATVGKSECAMGFDGALSGDSCRSRSLSAVGHGPLLREGNSSPLKQSAGRVLMPGSSGQKMAAPVPLFSNTTGQTKRQLPQLPTKGRLTARDMELRARQLLRQQMPRSFGANTERRPHASGADSVATAATAVSASAAPTASDMGHGQGQVSPEAEAEVEVDSNSDRDSVTSGFSVQSERPFNVRRSRLARTAWQHSSTASHLSRNRQAVEATGFTSVDLADSRQNTVVAGSIICSSYATPENPAHSGQSPDYPTEGGPLRHYSSVPDIDCREPQSEVNNPSSAAGAAPGYSASVTSSTGRVNAACRGGYRVSSGFHGESRHTGRRLPQRPSAAASAAPASQESPRRTGKSVSTRAGLSTSSASVANANAVDRLKPPQPTQKSFSSSKTTPSSSSATSSSSKSKPSLERQSTSQKSEDFDDAFRDDDLFDLSDFIGDEETASSANNASGSHSDRASGATASEKRATLGRSVSADVPDKLAHGSDVSANRARESHTTPAMGVKSNSTSQLSLSGTAFRGRH